MSDPLLPGIGVSPCIAVNEQPALRYDITAGLPDGTKITAALVLTPRQVRALCALSLRQLDLIEQSRGPLERVVP